MDKKNILPYTLAAVSGLRAELGPGKEGTLTAAAYLGRGGTLYTRVGWLFAPLSLVFTALAAACLLQLRRR